MQKREVLTSSHSTSCCRLPFDFPIRLGGVAVAPRSRMGIYRMAPIRLLPFAVPVPDAGSVSVLVSVVCDQVSSASGGWHR